MKKRSEQDGMMIRVHWQCHEDLHTIPGKMKELKARCQLIWMDKYGNEDDFRQRYKKSYLKEEQ